MEKLRCALCGEKRDCYLMDMEDIVFGNYVQIVRRLGLSKHKDNPGVCEKCMPDYEKMEKKSSKVRLLYGVLGAVLAALYLVFTGNIFAAIFIGLFVFGLSVFSYVPPLKKS